MKFPTAVFAIFGTTLNPNKQNTNSWTLCHHLKYMQKNSHLKFSPFDHIDDWIFTENIMNTQVAHKCHIHADKLTLWSQHILSTQHSSTYVTQKGHLYLITLCDTLFSHYTHTHILYTFYIELQIFDNTHDQCPNFEPFAR